MDGQLTPTVESQDSAQDKGAMRRRLGRGLNALLGGAASDSSLSPPPGEEGAVHATDEVSVELIERNPFQPRREFDKDAILELAESMITHGVLQPLLVRPHNGGYQLIAGERRWLAAKEAGMETVPCRVLELEDKSVCEVALVENVQRKDLGDLEKAQAFQDYLDRFGGKEGAGGAERLLKCGGLDHEGIDLERAENIPLFGGLAGFARAAGEGECRGHETEQKK